MSMFDQKEFLSKVFAVGEEFWIHDAGISSRDGNFGMEASLTVSREQNSGKKVVYQSGSIAGQIERMTEEDRGRFPTQVRMEEVNTGKGNPAKVLVPAGAEKPADDIPF